MKKILSRGRNGEKAESLFSIYILCIISDAFCSLSTALMEMLLSLGRVGDKEGEERERKEREIGRKSERKHLLTVSLCLSVATTAFTGREGNQGRKEFLSLSVSSFFLSFSCVSNYIPSSNSRFPPRKLSRKD